MLNKLSKRTKALIVAVLALFMVFIISYVSTDMYLDKKHKTQEEETNKNVTTSDPELLDENIKILLYTGDNQDKEQTIGEFKKERKIEKLSYNELVSILNKEGYKVSSQGEKTVSFKREKNVTIESGKYYLGFKEQILAIFKADENGKLEYVEDAPHLEEPITKGDIVSSRTKEEADKIENHQIFANTLEEIMEEASDY